MYYILFIKSGWCLYAMVVNSATGFVQRFYSDRHTSIIRSGIQTTLKHLSPLEFFRQKSGHIRANPLDYRASNGKKYSGKRLQPPTPERAYVHSTST